MESPVSPKPAEARNVDTLEGLGLAFASFVIWGCLPIYMKALDHIPAAEVVLHRIIWSVPIAGLVLLYLGRTADIKAALRSYRTLAMAVLTSGLISVNWGLYVWSIAVDRAVESALGYYITPLVNVLLAAVFLGEKLSRAQTAAVGIAGIGVAILTFGAGNLPWISLVLAFTFALYGFFRKTLPIGPSQGFFLEVMILSAIALPVAIWLALRGAGNFTPDQPTDFLLLIGCGPATAIPLLLYGFGARKLRFATIGLMQYITPTMIFLIAVLYFGEPFDMMRGIAFLLIWMALIIYSWSMFIARKTIASENKKSVTSGR